MVIKIMAMVLITVELPHGMEMTRELFQDGKKREGGTEILMVNTMIVVLFQAKPLNRNKSSKKINPSNCHLRQAQSSISGRKTGKDRSGGRKDRQDASVENIREDGVKHIFATQITNTH